MTDPIVFAPLTSSPETVGDDIELLLPALSVFGLEAAGAYGALELPGLETTGAGLAVVHAAASGVATLPPLASLGFQLAGGYGIASMPAMRTHGAPPGQLVPSSGSGTIDLPALATEGAGYRALIASATLALRPLWVYGQEAAGDYGVVDLPRLAVVGAEVPPATNFFYLVQSAGYLQAFAAEAQYLTIDSFAGEGDVAGDLKDVLVIKSALAGAFTAGNKLRSRPNITLSGVLSDPLSLAYGMLVDLESEGGLTDELVRCKTLAIVDTLAATLAVDSYKRAMLAVATAGVFRDAIALGKPLDVSMAGELAQAIEAKLVQLLAVDNAGVAGLGMGNTLRMSLIVDNEGVAALDAVSAVRTLFDTDLNGVMYLTLRFGGQDYSGWVMNTETLAPSEYRNFPFDGFATYQGQHFGFGPAGIVRFSGGTDDGEQIPAWLRTFYMDYGSTVEKRLSDVYIGATNAGQLVLKVVSYNRGTGKKLEDWYYVKSLPGEGVARGRAQVGQGLKSSWWQFELHNVAGSDFELEDINFRPILGDRRV